VILKGQGHDLNTLRAQQQSLIVYMGLVCCEAVRSAILATNMLINFFKQLNYFIIRSNYREN